MPELPKLPDFVPFQLDELPPPTTLLRGGYHFLECDTTVAFARLVTGHLPVNLGELYKLVPNDDLDRHAENVEDWCYAACETTPFDIMKNRQGIDFGLKTIQDGRMSEVVIFTQLLYESGWQIKSSTEIDEQPTT